jgi:hypothetical protein
MSPWPLSDRLLGGGFGFPIACWGRLRVSDRLLGGGFGEVDFSAPELVKFPDFHRASAIEVGTPL